MDRKYYVACGFFAKPEKGVNPLAEKDNSGFQRKIDESFTSKGIGELAT